MEKVSACQKTQSCLSEQPTCLFHNAIRDNAQWKEDSKVILARRQGKRTSP